MKAKSNPLLVLLVSALAVLLAGCGHGRSAQSTSVPNDPDPLGREIQQVVAQLRVNAGAFNKIYDGLHLAAIAEAGRSTNDIQLGYLQKVYLHVNQARTVAHYQVRLLSDFPYIEKDHRSDFLTLRAVDLDRAISAMEDSAGFLEVYAAFVKDQAVLAEIEKARNTLAGTNYLYEKLLATIKPSVNPAAPFSKDPYTPFARGAGRL